MLRRVLLGIELRNMESHVVLLSPFPDKSLIGITLFPAQMEVTMRYSEITPGFHEQLSHTHGIPAAADSKKGCLLFRKQPHQYLIEFLQHTLTFPGCNRIREAECKRLLELDHTFSVRMILHDFLRFDHDLVIIDEVGSYCQ